MDWIDIHTHKPGQGINVLDSCLGEIEIPKTSVVYHSLGIHPLLIDEHSAKRLEDIEESAAMGKIVAIGEAGLDRTSLTSLSEQLYWFKEQAKIAAHYHLPLLIHGVRAIPEIIALHNDFREHQNWIIHGFNYRKELLLDLLRHGFFVSVGCHILNQESNIYRNLLEIPDEYLFLETDDSVCSIEEIYKAVAIRKGIAIEELQRIIKLNFERVFLPWNG